MTPDHPPGTLFLIGNEPGYRPNGDSRSAEKYAVDFHDVAERLREIDPSFRVSVGPAVLSQDPRVGRDYVEGGGGLGYLERVLDAHAKAYGEPLRADYFGATAHVLAGDGADVGVFEQQILRLRRWLAAHGRRDARVIVSEWGVGVGGASPERIADFLRHTVRFLATARDPALGCPADDDRLVQRFGWFTAHPIPTLEKLRYLRFGALAIDLSRTSLIDRRGRPTHLGRSMVTAVQDLAAR